jgi:O-antigen/teichoic acid export membrane protein
MLSYAAAISNLLYVIVLCGVRLFQSTDIHQEYRFITYLSLRTCTAALASLFMLIFLIVRDFDLITISIVVLYFLIFLADGYADVFMGDLQQKGKMRIAGRMRVCAFGIAYIVFVIAAISTRTLIVPLFFLCMILIGIYIIWIWVYRQQYGKIRVKMDIPALKNLVSTVLPLSLFVFFDTFLRNAQKYYLEILDSYESVAIYAILNQPIQILLLCCAAFFLGAEMTKTALLFADSQLDLLSKRINRQLLFAICLSIIFIVCAFTFGIPVLSWIFNTDLSPYRREFILLALGGSSSSLLSVLSAGMIVMRKQKNILACWVTIAVTSGPLMWVLVNRYGITGAAYSSLVIYIPLTIFCFITYRVSLKSIGTQVS